MVINYTYNKHCQIIFADSSQDFEVVIKTQQKRPLNAVDQIPSNTPWIKKLQSVDPKCIKPPICTYNE